MKKLIVTLALCATATVAFSQGQVNFLNSSTTLITTNQIAGGPSTGGVAGAGLYYFGVFSAPMLGVGVPQSSFDPLNPVWQFTGAYGTNIAAAGRVNGGTAAAVQNWAAGETKSFAVVGWSATLGHDWNLIAAQLANGFASSPHGFYGQSGIGFAAAGGSLPGGGALPAFALFNSAGPSPQGTPLTTGFLIGVVPVPEPATFTLVGLGAAALLIFRRRK
jgi:hypothetical protein